MPIFDEVYHQLDNILESAMSEPLALKNNFNAAHEHSEALEITEEFRKVEATIIKTYKTAIDFLSKSLDKLRFIYPSELTSTSINSATKVLSKLTTGLEILYRSLAIFNYNAMMARMEQLNNILKSQFSETNIIKLCQEAIEFGNNAKDLIDMLQANGITLDSSENETIDKAEKV